MNRLLLTTTALASLLAVAAHADGSQVKPVSQRMLDDQNNGARLGSFLVIPTVDLEERYDDNIYATDGNAKTDFVTTVRPQASARSNWNRHALNLLAGAELNRFNNHVKENTNNYTAAFDGRVDIMRETSIGGGVAWNRAHEERGDPNSLATSLHPTEYDQTVGKLGIYRGLGKLNARLDGQVTDLDYKNDFTTGGALVNNNLRDRTEYAESLRVGYQAYPGYEVYAKGQLDNRVYDNKGVLNRNSRGQSGVAGLSVDLSGKTKGEAYAGYASRNYTVGDDINEPVYGAVLTWNATDLTTVLAHVSRTIEETTLVGSSGYVWCTYGADIQHALTRRWLATAGAEYGTYDYKGSGANQRSDDLWSASVGTKYYLTRHFIAGADYRFVTRDSNIPAGGFDRNVAMVRLTATF